jgi:hypothetical protein
VPGSGDTANCDDECHQVLWRLSRTKVGYLLVPVFVCRVVLNEHSGISSSNLTSLTSMTVGLT